MNVLQHTYTHVQRPCVQILPSALYADKTMVLPDNVYNELHVGDYAFRNTPDHFVAHLHYFSTKLCVFYHTCMYEHQPSTRYKTKIFSRILQSFPPTYIELHIWTCNTRPVHLIRPKCFMENKYQYNVPFITR